MTETYYTCRGKGGTYIKLGVTKGAGPRHNERLVVYKDVVTGDLYHREIRDFDDRMDKLPSGPALQPGSYTDEFSTFDAATALKMLDDRTPASQELLEILELDSEGGHCD